MSIILQVAEVIFFITATVYCIWKIRNGSLERDAERLKQRAHERGRDGLPKK